MEPEPKTLSTEIDRVVEFLSELNPTEEAYTKAADNLKTLCEARSKKKALVVEPETLVLAGVNLVGILLILRYEKFDIITSRALSLIRPK